MCAVLLCTTFAYTKCLLQPPRAARDRSELYCLPCTLLRSLSFTEAIRGLDAHCLTRTRALRNKTLQGAGRFHPHLWSSTLLQHRTRASGNARSTSASGQEQIASSERLSFVKDHAPAQAVRGAPAPMIDRDWQRSITSR